MFSRDAKSMIQNLNMVFHRLRTSDMKMHASKCVSGVKEVLYLGHTFNAQGYGLNQEKIKIVRDYTQYLT